MPTNGHQGDKETMTNHTEFDQEKLADTAVDKAQDTADQAQKKVGEVASVAKEQVTRTATRVGEQAKNTVDARMSDVAHELGSVADVVRQTSQEVGGDNQTIARYGEKFAEQIESVSSYLDERSLDDVLNDVQNFARRQPAVFLGGAFMLGLMVGRFLRSSERNMYRYGLDQYGQDYYASGQGSTYGYSSGQNVYPTGTSTGAASRTASGTSTGSSTGTTSGTSTGSSQGTSKDWE
jgi:hypothetical protein